MNSDQLIIAVLAGLGGMFGWGLADFFVKKTVDEIGSIVSLVWAHLFGTLALGAAVLYHLLSGGQLGQPTGSAWALLAVFGATQGLVYLLVYVGFGKGQLSVLNPIFAAYAGLAAILSLAFLGESASLAKVSALVIIFAGVMLLSVDRELLRAKRISLSGSGGVKEVLSACVLAAVWTVLWSQFVGGQDWLTYAFLMYGFMTIALYIFAKWKRTKLSGVKPSVWKFLAAIGVCEAVAYLSISLGFSLTSATSVVALLSGAFSLPAIILATLFLKERLSRAQQLGALAVIAGTALITLAK